MKLKETINYGLSIAILIAVIVSIFGLNQPKQIAVGSAIMGQDYNSTTTPSSWQLKPTVIKTGPGALAQVTITGTSTGTMYFYDATTTDKTKRTGNTATTTIAQFPNLNTQGTYTFDVTFNDGLILEIIGSGATSTISWR